MRVSELSSCSSGPWLPLHFHLDFLSPPPCHPSGQQNLHQAEPANIPASGSQQPSLTPCSARTCVTGVAICVLREGGGWVLWVSLGITPGKGSACPLSEYWNSSSSSCHRTFLSKQEMPFRGFLLFFILDWEWIEEHVFFYTLHPTGICGVPHSNLVSLLWVQVTLIPR